MIPGVVSFLPEATVVLEGDVVMDFVNGVYQIGATSYSAAEAVSEPGLITANGLEVPRFEEGTLIEIISPFNGRLLTGEFTLVAEFKITNDEAAGDEEIINVQGTTVYEPSGVATQFWRDSFSGEALAYDWDDDYDINGQRTAFDTNAGLGYGIHKVALTRTDEKLVISVDGRAIVSETFPPTNGNHEKAFIGSEDDPGYSGTSAQFILLSLSVFTPQDDEDLPTLSAVSVPRDEYFGFVKFLFDWTASAEPSTATDTDEHFASVVLLVDTSRGY